MSPDDFPDEIIEQTLAVWQPRTRRPLTPEDARQIIENVTGFFQLLARWDHAARQHANLGATSTETDENNQWSAR